MVAALLLASTLAFSGCDFAAKKLAKQTVEAAKQMAELQDKAAEIEDKVAALSPKDRRTFQEELVRLGVDAPEWLFNDEAALLTGAPEETGDEGGGGILSLIGGLFGGGSSSDGRGTSAWNGTWVSDDEDDMEGTLTFRNGDWEISMEGGPYMGGTLTTSGNDFRLAITKIHGGHSMWSELRQIGVALESKWYTKNQLRTALSSIGPFPDSILDELFTTFITGTYSISGNKLTLTSDEGEPATFTKRR